MSNKAQNLVAKAKNSIANLKNRASQLGRKNLPFSNDNFTGHLAKIQAWEDISMPYNQFFGNGIHE